MPRAGFRPVDRHKIVKKESVDELKITQGLDVFEIFPEHMVDRLYLDLAEEKSDLKIDVKLLQACQAEAEELFLEEMGNELQSELRGMMRLVRP